MSCTLDDVKRDALNEVKKIFKGNARSVSFKNDIATINYGNNYQVKTYNQAFKMAQSKLQAIEKWAYDKFGKKFINGWGHIDTTTQEQIKVQIQIPNNLLNAYTIKKARDIDYYKGDKQLMKQEEELYQISDDIKIPNAKIEETIKSWLTKVGIKYDPVDKIYDVEGNEIDAVAKADILNKTIEVIEGKRNLYTLPEEAAHMLVRIIGTKHSLIRAMMNNIDKYQVYDDVINSVYGEIYKNDENKLREEAVGKLISQIIVAQETGENMPAKIEVNRWNQAWNWLVNRLKKLIGTKVQDELLEFTTAANIITEQIEPMISEEWIEDSYEPGTIFYELNTEKTIEIVNKLKSTGIYYDAVKEAYFGPDGRRITKRVTQLIKELDSKRFKRQSQTEITPASKLAAAGGTVVHSYMNQITNYILNKVNNDLSKVGNVVITKSEIVKEVKTELLDNPNIKDRGEKFVEITDQMFAELKRDVINRLERINSTQEFINKETGEKGKVEILPEFIIYDPVRDVAGTIDLLVIYSNGKTSIYDYKGQKFFKDRQGKVTEDFRLSKITTGEDQLTIYSDILKKDYGIEEFAETRLIPINIQFDSKSQLSQVEVDAYGTERDYLEEVPVIDELTGIEIIDEQLKKMFIKRRSLNILVKKNWKDNALRAQLERLTKSIRKLQLTQDTRYLYLEVNTIIKDFEERVTRPDNSEKGVDFTYLNDTENYLIMYSGFFGQAKEIELSKDISTETRETIETKYNRIAMDVERTLRKIGIKNKELLVKKHNIDFNQSVKESSAVGNMFKKLSQFSRHQFKALYNLISRREKYVRDQIIDISNNLLKKKETLNNWAKDKGISLESAMNKLINKQGSLHSKYNGTYGKEKAEAIKNRDKQWFLDNTNIIENKGNLTYEDKESLDKFKESKDNYKKILKANQPGDYFAHYRVKKLEEWEGRHDISKNLDALFHQPYYIKPADNPRFHSEAWIYMNEAGNEPLLESYNTLINYNIEFAKKTGKDIKPTFIAEIQQSLVESVSNWSLGVDVLRNNFKKTFETRQEDVLMGSTVRDPNTGEILPNIPLLFTDNLSINITSKELEEIKKNLSSEKLEEGTYDYEEALSQAVATKEREKGILVKSKDLFTSTLLFAETAYTYSYTQEMEDEIKALQSSLIGAKTDPTSASGKKLIDKVTGRVAQIVGAPHSEMETFEKFVKMHIYGQRIQNKDFTLGNKISSNKTLHQVMSYTSLKALGLSWITAFGNAVGISSNLLMAASEGKYFNLSQVKKSIKLVTGKNKDTINPLISYFSPYAHNITYDMSKKLSVTKARRYFNEELFYKLMKYPDKAIDVLVCASILQEWGITEDGRIRRIQEGVKPLIETMQIKDDKVIPLTEEQYTIVRKLMTTASNKIKGSMSREDHNLVGTSIYTALFMQFRNWMPGLINSRFQELTYDEEIDEMDVGRFKILFGEFTRKGLLPKLKTFSNLVLEVSSFGILKQFSTAKNNEIAEKYFRAFLEENPELVGKVTIEDYIELRTKKLKGMAAELRILLGLYGAVALIGAAVPDDDEGDNSISKLLAMNSYRMTNRGLLEISFFFDPNSVLQIINKPLPILRNIKDVTNTISNTLDVGRTMLTGQEYKGTFDWEKQDKDKTGMFYYSSKMVPARVFTDVIDFFDTFEQYID